MFAIQPLPLPSATQMLLAIAPAGEMATDAGFEAQFSALLASAVPAEALPAEPNAAARPALPGARSGKDEAANGKLPGKILPDLLAALQADSEPEVTETDASSDPALDDPMPVSATQTLQLVLAQISAPAAPTDPSAAATPARASAPPVVAAAPGLPAKPAAASAEAPPVRWLAMASTAPATATTAMPAALTGGTALPPPAFDPAPAAQNASPAMVPDDAPKVGLLANLALPAIRIPLGIGAPIALPPQQPAGDAKAETPAQPAQVAIQLPGQPVLQAQAASLAMVQHASKAADPAAPLAAPASQITAQNGAELASAGLEAIAAAPQPLSSPAIVAAGAAIPASVQPHDFAALIDRLVEARQAVQSTLTNQTVQTSVQHAEFGRVSLAFQQDAAGMTVSFVGPDPDLARAVQTFAPAALSADIRTADSGASSQRQDGQGGSASANSGQSQGQPQGQLSAQQQRGQSSQREAAFGSTAQDRPSGNDAESPSDPRSGIFA